MSFLSLRGAILWRRSNLVVGAFQNGIASPPSMTARNDGEGLPTFKARSYTMGRIAADAGLTPDEFRRLL
jgi:hypothetical protein